jgi:hypothetical protein
MERLAARSLYNLRLTTEAVGHDKGLRSGISRGGQQGTFTNLHRNVSSCICSHHSSSLAEPFHILLGTGVDQIVEVMATNVPPAHSAFVERRDALIPAPAGGGAIVAFGGRSVSRARQTVARH